MVAMTTHLTDSQKQTIRIALGTWAGWLDIKPNRRGQLCGKCPNTAPNVYSHLPDWIKSLDACHEIISKLSEGQLKDFRDALAKIKGCAWYQSAVLLSSDAEDVAKALFDSLLLAV